MPNGTQHTGLKRGDGESRRAYVQRLFEKEKPSQTGVSTEEWIEAVKRGIVDLKPDEIDTIASVFAALTTPLKFAFNDLIGWADSGLDAEIHAHIHDDAKSSDGWISLDLFIDIEQLKKGASLRIAGRNGIAAAIGSQPSSDAQQQHGIWVRVEIKKDIAKELDKDELRTCNWITVKGALKFDQDGHVEIHPRKPGDVTPHGHTSPRGPGSPGAPGAPGEPAKGRGGGSTGSGAGRNAPSDLPTQRLRRPEKDQMVDPPS
ncbi:MAG: hypothetical protein H6807_15270 [Planctomycetes bacterium]|nr:hypothetical protein [Planctomycetota bacterium]